MGCFDGLVRHENVPREFLKQHPSLPKLTLWKDYDAVSLLSNPKAEIGRSKPHLTACQTGLLTLGDEPTG
jgi:hypothetical protein